MHPEHTESVRWGAQACELRSSQHANFSPTGPGPGLQGRRAASLQLCKSPEHFSWSFTKRKNKRTSVGQVSGVLEEALFSDRQDYFLKQLAAMRLSQSRPHG